MLIQSLINKINSLNKTADETIIFNIENILPKGWKIKRVIELYDEEVWEIYNTEGIPVVKVVLTETTLRTDGGNINVRAESI